MSNKKRIATWLKKQAEILPEETYIAYHKYNKPIWEKMEDGNIGLVGGEAENHLVNHGRRLKRIFDREGKAGVDKYFEDRGFKLIKNKKDDSI